MATQTERCRLRRRRGAGHRARHVPGGEHDLHRPDRVRPVEHAVRALFLPQVITAITAALLGAGLARPLRHEARVPGRPRRRPRLDAPAPRRARSSTRPRLAYPLLLARDRVPRGRLRPPVPALNTLTAAFHPDGVDASVLVLNALLGLGTALAPVFVAIFVGLGFWWGLPLLSAILLVVLVVVSVRPAAADGGRRGRGDAARPGSRAASGCTPGSRCSTASARRSTATGRSST